MDQDIRPTQGSVPAEPPANTTSPATPKPDSAATPELPKEAGVNAAAPSPEPKKTGKLKSIGSTLLIILIAPLLALFIVSFVFQSYQVDGQSMETTLQDNDRLIIWKLPRTWARLTNKDYQPNRGDIIVFVRKGTFENEGSREKQLIKRVIGLPGERVVVKDGTLKVFNEGSPDGFNPDATMEYGKVITGVTEGNVDVTVQAGEVFVLGDNRGNSQDSRYFGPVTDEDIVGKLIARILPVNKADKY